MLIYGLGSLTTALSPNLGVLLFGWSFIEAFGAVLVIPAIAALTAITYSGRQRALAYGIIGGVSGASAALGPLIGGWVTANYTWRLVFAGETVVVLILMLFLKAIPATQGREMKMDDMGAFLSAAGLGAAVFGILFSSQWGWVTPKAGAPFTLLGLSPVFWLIILGLVLLGAFSRHEERIAEAGKEPLLDMKLLHIPRLRAGLTTLLSQQLIIMSTFFVLPLYLQSVLGYDALETGKRILPLSISLFVCALAGSAVTGRYSPKRIVEVGLFGMMIGEVLREVLVELDLDHGSPGEPRAPRVGNHRGPRLDPLPHVRVREDGGPQERFHRAAGGDKPIMDTWWQTETGSILITPLRTVPLKPGSATRPFLGIEADVVDREGNSLPANQGGFAVIEKPWPSMMRTIYKDPERYKTYWNTIPNCYTAGDICHKDADGYMWFMGRRPTT